MKKKNRGFTLIELLAVIVILAIIALIAVPQVIKILNKSRLSAAEDSTYGIIKSVDTYVANFMLKNDGSFPTGQMKFNCNSGGCKLDTNLTGYNLNGLEELNFKGSKPRDGEVVVSNNGQTIKVNNLKINGFICNYPNNDGKVSCENSNQSLEISIGLTQTIDSIKVVVSTNVNVKEYEYSIDGENYYKSTDNTYIFTGLKQNTEYTIYVRVSNGKETKEEKSKINTLSLNIPEITVDKKDIWTQSKTVTIKYPSGDGLVYSYKIKSLDGNTILVDDTLVTEETTNIEITENSIVVATVTLGSNFQSITEEVTNIDRTAPTDVNISYEIKDNSIKLVSSGKDLESGIYGYQFSIDGGTTWLPNEPQKTNTYTFNNLNYGDTYNLKIRVINNTYLDFEINEFNTKESDLVSIDLIPELTLEYVSGSYATTTINNNNLSISGAGFTYKLSLPISGYSFDWYQSSYTGAISFCDLADNCEKLPYSKCDNYAGNYCANFGDTYTNTEPGYIRLSSGGVKFDLTNIVYNSKSVNIRILPLPAPTPAFYSGENCTIYQGSLRYCGAVDLENGTTFSNDVYVVGSPQFTRQIKINDGEWQNMTGSSFGYYYAFTENGTYKFRIRTKVTTDDIYSEETDDFYLTIKK